MNNRLNFVSANAEQRSNIRKSTFQRSSFNNGMTFTLNRVDFVVPDDKKEDKEATPCPCLRLNLNGVEFKDILFISTCYRDDMDIDCVMVPKSGSLNQIVKSIWDNPAFVTDDACLAELQRQIGTRQIKVVRKAIPIDATKPDGPKHKIEVYGRTQTLNQLNFDLV